MGGGGVWWRGQLQRELRALSGVGGVAAGMVRCDPSGSSYSAIALLRWSVSPTVGKFSVIILSAVEASRLRWVSGSAHMGICRRILR